MCSRIPDAAVKLAHSDFQLRLTGAVTKFRFGNSTARVRVAGLADFVHWQTS